MNLTIGSFMLLLCWSFVNANVIPEEQLNGNVMPSLYPTVQAESYSYITSGAYIYNDCGSTTVGNLRNKGMLTFNKVDIGVDGANCVRIRYSNKAAGTQTKIEVYIEHPVLGGKPIATAYAVRTNDWCDFAEVINDGKIVNTISGIQTFYLVFTIDDAPASAGCDIDWFSLEYTNGLTCVL
ncbi:hypothetical protein CHUAL_008836 [Chamberlinius hualienensis]